MTDRWSSIDSHQNLYLFFGRRPETVWLVEQLVREQPLVAVYGPHHIGNTSFLHALSVATSPQAVVTDTLKSMPLKLFTVAVRSPSTGAFTSKMISLPLLGVQLGAWTLGRPCVVPKPK